MPRFGIIVLLLLLGAAPPSCLKAQTMESHTFTTNCPAPDGNAAGLGDVRHLNSAIGAITSLQVRLKISGEFNGDLYAYLRHAGGFTVLLNRPGKTGDNDYGYPDSGLEVTFQDGAVNGDMHGYQAVTIPVPGGPLTGVWQPDGRTNDPANVLDTSPRTTALTSFNGLNAAGDWTLYVCDTVSGGTNLLAEWGLDITGAACPTLTWATPADLAFGSALCGAQLNASATYDATNVAGTFTYTPAAGTVLSAGSNQMLTVTFTPADTTDFLACSTSVTINVVNPPPLAAVMTVTRLAGLPLLIAWSDVATNWSDADGDPVTLTGVNLVTTNGVTLTTNSAWIYYPKAPNVNDQFSYTIGDGQGGANTGLVNIVILNRITGTNSITKIVVGNPTILTAYGIPGFSYITERATNLAPPAWVNIATNLAATNGIITVLDYFHDLGNHPPESAFYQLLWQP